MVGAVIGVVGDDVGVRLQAALDEIEDVGIERLGAVEQHQIDRIGRM